MRRKDRLFAIRLPDNSSDWLAPDDLGQIPDLNSNGNSNATFTIDPVTDKYFVAYSKVEGMTQTIYAGAEVPSGPQPLPPVATFPTTSSGREVFDFIEPGIAIHPSGSVYIAMNPTGDNGPPPPNAPVQIVVAPSGPSIPITPPSGLNYFPAGFTGSLDPDKANAAILMADLNSLTGGYYVGQVKYSDLSPSYDPSKSLTATTPPVGDGGGTMTFKNLFVNASSQHWEIVAPVGEQFLIIGPTANPVTQQLYGGLNFAWWDGATGILRAYQSGDNNLFGDVNNIANADVTVAGLNGSIASLFVAYLVDVAPPQGGGGPITAGDLWFSGIGCLKQ